MNFEVRQERFGRLDQALHDILPAMTSDARVPVATTVTLGELLLDIPPEPLDQIELGRVGQHKERFEPGGVVSPHLAQCMAFVVADIVEDQHDRLVGGQRLGEVVEEGGEGGFPLRALVCQSTWPAA